jgi:AmmeMemoRadiSam system protein A
MASLTAPLRQQLLALAADAIRAGLDGRQLTVRIADYPEPLHEPRASFVTLHLDECLRGCIGSLEARRPLAEDVVYNAYGAAFEDPRFPTLTLEEFERLDIHLSILSPPEPMMFSTEADLVAQLRPHVDGLVIEEGWRRGTFLPSVWEQLSDPYQFLRHLKRKAGLPEDYWSETIRIKRYTVEAVP